MRRGLGINQPLNPLKSAIVVSREKLLRTDEGYCLIAAFVLYYIEL